MKIIEKSNKLEVFLEEIKKKGQKIGLIPTMGSIHEGHLSLVKKCKDLNYFTLITIFINPTQFNDNEDYKKYPKNIEKDILALKTQNSDLLFLPKINEIYTNGIKSSKSVFQYRDILCDKFRSDHFDGVTTVVSLLFDLIKPNYVFLGEKDYQQYKLIEKLIEINNSKITIFPCKSIRMKNGISYSSRYNNFEEHHKKILNDAANKIISAYNKPRRKIDNNIIFSLKKDLKKINITKIDYIEIRNEKNLKISNQKNQSRLFIAFYIEKIRIIDNFILY